jgi:hypothetical protein
MRAAFAGAWQLGLYLLASCNFVLLSEQYWF